MKRAMSALLVSSMLLAGCSSQDATYDPKVFNDYAISSTDYSTLNYLYSFAADRFPDHSQSCRWFSGAG